MFRTKDTYLLTISNLSEFRLEKAGSTNIISRLKIPDDIISNGKIIDKIQLSYMFNKFLSEIKERDRIVVRYSSLNNIFRVHRVEGIEEKDLEGYMKYNLDEILPFSRDSLSIKYQIAQNQVMIYGVDMDILEFIEETLGDLNHKNLFFTVFPSEVVSFWMDHRDMDFIFLNVETDFLEYIIFEKSKIVEYRIVNLESTRVCYGEFPNGIVNSNMGEILDSIIGNSNDSFLKILAIGDWDLVNIWDIVLSNKYGKNIICKPFDVEKYFGEGT